MAATMAQMYRKYNEERENMKRILEREGADEKMTEEILSMIKQDFLSDLRYERRTASESLESLENVCSVKVTAGIDADIRLSIDGLGWIDDIEDERISEGIRKLSPRDKKVVSAYVFEGYGTIPETAEHLHLTDKQVRSSLQRVRGKIDISRLRS